MNLTEKPALNCGVQNDADEDGLRVRNPCTVRGAVVERFIERPTVSGDLRPDLEEVIERDGSRQGPQARQASTHWRLPYFEIRIRSVDEKSAGAVVPLNWRTGSPTSALGRIRLTVALMMEWVQAKPRLLEVGEAPIEPHGLVFAEQINPLATGQT